MKEILEELKRSMGGIIGSFVLNEEGQVTIHNVPVGMIGSIHTFSKGFRNNINKTTTSFDNITIDSDSAKLVVMPANGGVLVVIVEKDVNMQLLKLNSNMAISKIKESPEDMSAEELDRICDIYDQMFEVAAKKLTPTMGPRAGKLFNEKLEGTRKKHPALSVNVGFDRKSKPQLVKIKINAREMSKKELIDGLEDILVAMLEGVKSAAGSKITREAIDEIEKIKEALKK
jgi:predicted regulator of Ras-like GTPase activity (Roadblock/LC7/MglB family)